MTVTAPKPGMVRIDVLGCRCDRCGHQWLPRDRTADPARCPKYKSRRWNEGER